MRLLAPAKVNLCLYLGSARTDGLHEICSLFVPLSLADVVEVEAATQDSVFCPGVEGENLATVIRSAPTTTVTGGAPIKPERSTSQPTRR